MAHRILIIGSGISGISAGRALHQAGKEVLIIDKGRRIGGRVSTRRADGFIFDHGAQFFTAHHAPLTELCASAIASGKIQSWARPSGKQGFIGAEMMRDLPEFLATLPDGSRLSIQQDTEIAQIIDTGGEIQLIDKGGDIIAEADQLIVTAPAPQTVNLLKEAAPELSQTAASALYHPCWTVMLGLKTDRHNIGFDLPQIEAPEADLSFAALSHLRRPNMETAPALVLQASASWSQTHLEETQEMVITALRALYETHLSEKIPARSLPDIAYASAHRWRYAKLAKAADAGLPRTSLSGQIHLAGDWLTAPRIESAFMSGLAAAENALAL